MKKMGYKHQSEAYNSIAKKLRKKKLGKTPKKLLVGEKYDFY
jgi:hypothetical protein